VGTRERQLRERLSMRRAILDAARELFVAEGFRTVSMRKIADRIEYSPAAIYSYFESKDDIFFALAEEGFRILEVLLEQIAVRPGDPLEAVRLGFWEFYQFSKTHPQYFELMFVDRSVPSIIEAWDRFSFVHAMLTRAAGLIKRCVEDGVMPPDTNPDVAFHILLAAVHGATVLALCGRMAPDEDPDLLVRDTLETTLAGLRSGVATTFTVSALAHRREPHDASAGAPRNDF
jgi:AcrR family transcriptional regulator